MIETVGKEYLKFVLGDLLHELLNSDVNLEIDPGKFKQVENAEKLCQENQILLKEWTTKFLNRIQDEDVLKKMPNEVRIVAAFIAQISNTLKLNTPVLIGSYLMLRFFNPAIATPSVYGIVDSKFKSKYTQRNLILITKIMQVKYILQYIKKFFRILQIMLHLEDKKNNTCQV